MTTDSRKQKIPKPTILASFRTSKQCRRWGEAEIEKDPADLFPAEPTDAAPRAAEGAVAQVCYLNNTPFVVIRAISDKEDGSSHVEYETFKAEAARNCADIVRYMVAAHS